MRIVGAVTIGFALGASAGAIPGPHPDHAEKTISWYTNWQEAQTAATAAGKVILIEYGSPG